MKILLATRSPIPAARGDSVYILELVDHLEKRGYELDVFAHLTKERDFYAGFQSNFHQVGSLIEDTRKMTAIVRERGIELIHGFFHMYSESGFYSSYQTKIPFVCEFPDDPLSAMMLASRAQSSSWGVRVANEWLKTLLHASSYLIVQSQTLADYYEKVYGARVNGVLPLCVPVEFFRKDGSLDLRRRLGIQDDEICVLFVGDFVYWHGGETLAQAIPLVLEQSRKVKFLLIGGFSSVSFDLMKGRLAQLEDLRNSVILLRDIPYAEMPRYHGIADISLAPHINPLTRPLGCSPRKILEYMASGKPIICSDLPEIREIVDGSFGLFTIPGDANDLADKILSLACDHQRRQQMGHRAREKAERLFDVEKRIEAVADVYQSLESTGSNINLRSALMWIAVLSIVYRPRPIRRGIQNLRGILHRTQK